MSTLENLIKKYCPNGVKYVELNSVIDYEQPSKYIVKDTKYNDDYDIPVLTAGQSFILGYTNEKDGIYKANRKEPVIIFDDFTTSFHWVDFNFKVKSSAMKMLKVIDENKSNFRYLYYCMKNIQYSPLDHTRQWIEKYSKFTIPLPLIEVQKEIVRILDEFTLKTAELQELLHKEYISRKKQYEYYRDKLLTFGDDVEWKILDEIIISLNTGLNPRQFFRLNTDDAQNYYVTIRELQNNTIKFTEKTDRINDEALKLCNKRSNLEIGDVLFSGTGTIGETAIIEEYPNNWNIKEGIYTIKPNKTFLVPKFLMYLLKSSYIKNMYLAKADGGTVKSVPMKEMRNLKIPVPPLEEQERIVKILDRFDVLCNDISSGLPAEIEMRKKQYEYYRDKLLTFKEKKI
ncbi:restriction endonuclease subunit S [Brachyspira hyodysenteriae]|uniref:restriction endonuclease subunit S n=1 Tax=Brachyspira hyodysenteriae TaxID=159 RepID=UPI00063DD3E0|nr:restriction endonuclease subunit S [Brachyspira hyodysenteriae]KLI41326.1 restriction endonuclease subunit S [Brachyspira hyodysenteriae]